MIEWEEKSWKKRQFENIKQGAKWILKWNNKFNDLDVHIRSRSRFTKYYQSFLSETLKKLHKKIKYMNIPVNRNKVLSSLLSNLAFVLDQHVINYKDRNNNHYQRKSLEKELEIISKNFTEFCIRSLERIENNFEPILNGYADIEQLDRTYITLEDLSSAGSDYHRGGEHVLCLTLKDAAGNTGKVYYKPSSLVADTLILGDIQKLKETDPSFEGYSSLIEIHNKGLEEIDKLPTYLIMPIYHPSPELDPQAQIDVHGHFGFVQNVSKGMRKDPDFVTVVDNHCSKFEEHHKINKSNILAQEKEMQAEIDAYIKNEIANDPSCIIMTDEEERRFARDCGRLLAIMYVGGVIDSHCENLIIFNGRPIIIDAEICLSPHCMQDIKNTLCAEDSGSMNAHATRLKHINYLTRENLNVQFNIRHPEKNRLYRLVVDEEGHPSHLQVCVPNPDLVAEGFMLGLQQFEVNKEELEKWYDSDKVQNMLIRVPLYPTDLFQQDKEYLETHPHEYETYRREKIREGHQEFYNPDKNPLHYTSQVPCYIAYTDPLTGEELLSSNIPWFCGQANGENLYNANGLPLYVPIENTDVNDIIEGKLDPDQTRVFFNEGTPLQHVKGNVMDVLNDPEKTEELAQELRTYFQNYQVPIQDPMDNIPINDNSALLESKATIQIEKIVDQSSSMSPRRHSRN